MENEQNSIKSTRIGHKDFRWGSRTYVMGIINMSPESFSGDGIAQLETAVEQARRLVSEGADILDVGGIRNGAGNTHD